MEYPCGHGSSIVCSFEDPIHPSLFLPEIVMTKAVTMLIECEECGAIHILTIFDYSKRPSCRIE